MKLAENVIEKAIGLMFAPESKIKRGMCFVNKKEVRTGITTVFCTLPLEIIFVNNNNVVVDKARLQPWILNYKPKKPYKYAVESVENTFKQLSVGAKVQIQ